MQANAGRDSGVVTDWAVDWVRMAPAGGSLLAGSRSGVLLPGEDEPASVAT